MHLEGLECTEVGWWYVQERKVTEKKTGKKGAYLLRGIIVMEKFDKKEVLTVLKGNRDPEKYVHVDFGSRYFPFGVFLKGFFAPISNNTGVS